MFFKILKFLLHAADNNNVVETRFEMSINLYGNIGTTYTGIVTGAELERVSQEIFGGAQVKSTEKTSPATQQTPSQQVSPSQINLYNRNTDINLTQQVAQAKADFNVVFKVLA